MRILILGGAGMLGHQLWRCLAPNHDIWVTVRTRVPVLVNPEFQSQSHVLTGVDATNHIQLTDVFRRARPQVVVNCIGIVKQLPEAEDPLLTITTNALLPHWIDQLCSATGARLLHFSTDCVFSGRKGGYTEKDISDAEDLYGRTKFLGEVNGPRALTLRTSIIGLEIAGKHGLIEWYRSQRDKSVRGYRNAIYSGFSTIEMARIVEMLLTRFSDLSGIWHVSSNPISKYDLLLLARSAFKSNNEIVADESVRCDRSLDSTAFRNRTGYQPPQWPTMLQEMADQDRSCGFYS